MRQVRVSGPGWAAAVARATPAAPQQSRQGAGQGSAWRATTSSHAIPARPRRLFRFTGASLAASAPDGLLRAGCTSKRWKRNALPDLRPSCHLNSPGVAGVERAYGAWRRSVQGERRGGCPGRGPMFPAREPPPPPGVPGTFSHLRTAPERVVRIAKPSHRRRRSSGQPSAGTSSSRRVPSVPWAALGPPRVPLRRETFLGSPRLYPPSPFPMSSDPFHPLPSHSLVPVSAILFLSTPHPLPF